MAVTAEPTIAPSLPTTAEVERRIAAGMCAGAEACIRASSDPYAPVRAAWFDVWDAPRAEGPPGPPPWLIVERCVQEAIESGIPVVGVIRGHSTAARVEAGIDDLAGWGGALRSLAAASGVVPTALGLDGELTGFGAMALGLVDVAVATASAAAHLASVRSVAEITGRVVPSTSLGGATALAACGAVAHVAADLADAVGWLDEVLGHLPPNCMGPAPQLVGFDPPDRRTDGLDQMVPDDPRRGYDVRAVVSELVDDGDLVELSAGFGPAMVCALARLDGTSVGIVANQPAQMAGAIDIASSQKAARFVNWCDAFGLPIVTLVDTPGYLPGRDLEWEGMIRHGGQLAFAYAQATCPRVSIVLRKAFGGAYIVMDSKTMGNDAAYAWPGAQLAVMGASGAVQILHGRALSDDDGSRRARLEAEYTTAHLNPDEAVRRGLIDEVVEPVDTRRVLCGAVRSLRDKRPTLPERRHSNGPL
jgi:acetyl-CoA carboxylase carboxyltransferase component